MRKKTLVFISPINKGGTYFYYEGITQYLQKHHSEQFNIIFAHSLKEYLLWHLKKADIIFSIIPFFFKPIGAKKYIFNLHGNYKIERRNKGLGVKLMYLTELNFWFADKIILTSYYLADKLGFRSRYKNKISIVPNYILIDDFLYPKRSFDSEDYNILTVTSFKFHEKGKGILNLKRVVNQLAKKTSKKVSWTIVGNQDNDIFNKIKKEFDTIVVDINVKIVFVGWKQREEIIQLYKANDYFLYWTELDNYPGVVLEAIVSGMKVFVNDFESFQYFIDQSIIAKDEKEMFEKILIKDYENQTKVYSLVEIAKEILKSV